jgi:hypothetical protein
MCQWFECCTLVKSGLYNLEIQLLAKNFGSWKMAPCTCRLAVRSPQVYISFGARAMDLGQAARVRGRGVESE